MPKKDQKARNDFDEIDELFTLDRLLAPFEEYASTLLSDENPSVNDEGVVEFRDKKSFAAFLAGNQADYLRSVCDTKSKEFSVAMGIWFAVYAMKSGFEFEEAPVGFWESQKAQMARIGAISRRSLPGVKAWVAAKLRQPPPDTSGFSGRVKFIGNREEGHEVWSSRWTVEALFNALPDGEEEGEDAGRFGGYWVYREGDLIYQKWEDGFAPKWRHMKKSVFPLYVREIRAEIALEWLRKTLNDGPVRESKIRAEARHLGHDWRLVQKAQRMSKDQPGPMVKIEGPHWRLVNYGR